MSKWRATSNGADWGQTRPNDGLLTIYPGVVEQPPLSIHLHHGAVAGTHEGAVVTLDDDDSNDNDCNTGPACVCSELCRVKLQTIHWFAQSRRRPLLDMKLGRQRNYHKKARPS